MTTTRKLTAEQKTRLQLLFIGAGLLAMPLFLASLATNAAVNHGHDADVWWLWLMRAILAALAIWIGAVVVLSEVHRPAK